MSYKPSLCRRARLSNIGNQTFPSLLQGCGALRPRITSRRRRRRLFCGKHPKTRLFSRSSSPSCSARSVTSSFRTPEIVVIFTYLLFCMAAVFFLVIRCITRRPTIRNSVGVGTTSSRSSSHGWFPPSRIRSRIRFHSKLRWNYVHPQEFRKNSAAYLKNSILRFRKFAVTVDPFI